MKALAIIVLLLACCDIAAKPKDKPYPMTFWIIDCAHKHRAKITWDDAFDVAKWTYQYSIESHVDQDWMLAIWATEDPTFDPEAEDGVGSYSIPQIQCSTAQIVADKLGLNLFITPKMLEENPELAIRLACRHYHDLLEEFGGDPIKATRAYNWGATRIRVKRLRGLKYFDNVFHRFMEYETFKEAKH